MKKLFNYFIYLLLFTTCLLFSPSLFAHDKPTQFFTRGDWQLFVKNQLFALNHTPDNKKLKWNNPYTSHSGYFIPYDSRVKNGVLCRNIEASISAQGEHAKHYSTFCKIKRRWERM